ncbi:putative glyoxalase superfamily protein PhnB [Aeromicrobium panaciterrae]|uniref:Glyoxalase superfamily protein PhnB n=1 Tax=Aeromicrobium panaciterrae TaxID=363861 RepID=A0ABU1UKQ5_9ACTN|nr:glyoxalase [Aeromicrobium panaciterrae]MDR7085772.1 putative glyoxalase superfamily protein PhnB [Aeromicrobium panaciterrae]
MTNINHITLEVTDTTAAKAFYAEAFDVDKQIELRQASDQPSDGFRGYTLSLVVAQPSTVDSLFASALEAGATEIKPVTNSFWGHGGSLQAPDGTIWKIASSSKKETGPATRQIDGVVLLLGVDDVKATKQFYADQGLKVGKSFGSKYVEFETTNVKLALYGRKALAKDAGVPADGTGSHRIAINSDAGTFADLDGFSWE